MWRRPGYGHNPTDAPAAGGVGTCPPTQMVYLPAPDRCLAGVGPAHDLRCAAAVCREQDDLCQPDLLLWTVPTPHDRRKGAGGRRHSTRL